MSRRFRQFLFLGLLLFQFSTANAQFSGSRGGISRGGGSRGEESGHENSGLKTLDSDVVQSYITIDGQAELRIKPTEIRIVLAITAEGKNPSECKQLVTQKIAALKAAWKQTDHIEDGIVEDFIAVLPKYEFEFKKVDNREIAIEKNVGFLMQINLHVAVKNDAEAMKAINTAFENDVSDIIAFDYWSKELDQLKVKARAAAVKAAREKSDVLLGALFEKRPPVINLQESTRVYYPESLYESFTNSSESNYQTTYSNRNIPQIRLFRPKNTYYRGLYLDADVQSDELPMQSEISVVSTVRLYYESPVAKEYRSSKNGFFRNVSGE